MRIREEWMELRDSRVEGLEKSEARFMFTRENLSLCLFSSVND